MTRCAVIVIVGLGQEAEPFQMQVEVDVATEETKEAVLASLVEAMMPMAEKLGLDHRDLTRFMLAQMNARFNAEED